MYTCSILIALLHGFYCTGEIMQKVLFAVMTYTCIGIINFISCKTMLYPGTKQIEYLHQLHTGLYMSYIFCQTLSRVASCHQ